MNKKIYTDEKHRRLREIMRRYRATHQEKVRAINRRAWERNKEKRHAEQRRYAVEHPLTSVHNAMMKRCGHRKGTSMAVNRYYESRGIRVCQEWHSFPVFERWALANGYQKGLQIDRINTNGDYCPENCRFVSPHENAMNRRSSVRVEWNGQIIPLMKVYEQLSTVVSYLTFKDRVLRYGWSIEEAARREPRRRSV